MQVVLHTGAHFTDEDRLLNCLEMNRDLLATQGVSLPRPKSYRRRLRDLLHDVQAAPLADGVMQTFLDEVNTLPDPDRVVFSNENFFGVPKIAIKDNKFYPVAEGRLADFCSLFPGDSVEMFMGIRNPATLLPALLRGSPAESLDTLTDGSVPTALRWSELVTRLRENLPTISLTIWCNEDTPMIWDQLMREMSGVDPMVKLEGVDALLAEIMSKEGMTRYRAYLDSHPGMTEVQKRRVIAAFLDKFALEDVLEEELDLPGWTDEFVETLTDIYDEDVYQIERMPGVNLITP
ncbi:hypothetical protein [Shimia biformata]|uniref:hypothetical protein n=1 Tax=Shimia biformata TaxID=1294299 RepID=UPI00194E137F|nr:hypothetical protein [Shimia biformata]